MEKQLWSRREVLGAIGGLPVIPVERLFSTAPSQEEIGNMAEKRERMPLCKGSVLTVLLIGAIGAIGEIDRRRREGK